MMQIIFRCQICVGLIGAPDLRRGFAIEIARKIH